MPLPAFLQAGLVSAEDLVVKTLNEATKSLSEAADALHNYNERGSARIGKRIETALTNPHLTTAALRFLAWAGQRGLQNFKHSPLAQNDMIRLLRIQPAVTKKTEREGETFVVRCEMQCFNAASRPSYMALSYTWGSPAEKLPITINGKVCFVRRNLFQFLMHARTEKHITLWYWIDALCIDQDNIPERNEIVGRMRDIYSSSDSVVIWLGAEDNAIEKALLVVDKLTGCSQDFEELRRKLSEVENEASEMSELAEFKAWRAPIFRSGRAKVAPGNEPLTIEDMVNLNALFEHQYWSRIWVLQEASTPEHDSKSGSTTVQYGHQVRLFSEVLLALLRFLSEDIGPRIRDAPTPRLQMSYVFSTYTYRSEKYSFPSTVVTNRTNTSATSNDTEETEPIFHEEVFQTCNGSPLDLVSLLPYARLCEATDPRDRIYALLGIAPNGGQFRIDYELSTGPMFVAFAKSVISRDGNLEILGFANGCRELDGLPSWVPDWTAKKVAHQLPQRKFNKVSSRSWRVQPVYESAKGLSTGVSITIDQDVLIIGGVVFDYITELGIDFENPFNNRRGPRTPYVTGRTLYSAIAHTLVADYTDANLTEINRGASTPHVFGGIDRSLAEELRHGDLNSNEAIFAEMTSERQLVFTSKGYVGLVAWTVQLGDLICIAEGAQAPLVLRKDWTESGFYQFAGDCYIHGIMDGEALLESAPGNVCGAEIDLFKIR